MNATQLPRVLRSSVYSPGRTRIFPLYPCAATAPAVQYQCTRYNKRQSPPFPLPVQVLDPMFLEPIHNNIRGTSPTAPPPSDARFLSKTFVPHNLTHRTFTYSPRRRGTDLPGSVGRAVGPGNSRRPTRPRVSQRRQGCAHVMMDLTYVMSFYRRTDTYESISSSYGSRIRMRSRLLRCVGRRLASKAMPRIHGSLRMTGLSSRVSR